MADVVNVGITDNDGNGDTLRAAFSQINTRFNELLGTIDGGDAWAPTTAYTATPVRQWVINSGQAYVAAENHTSGATFAADLAAGKWFAVDSAQIVADLAASTGAGMVGFAPTGTIASTTVQTAIAEINTDLAASSGASLVGYLPAGTGVVATTVQTKLRESVSVKDFGAVGDGVTDDTAAIQAAIYYGAISGKAMFFPAGNYRVTSSIELRCSIYGEATYYGDVTTITADNAVGFTVFTNDTSTGTLRLRGNIDGINFKSTQTKIHTAIKGDIYRQSISNSRIENYLIGARLQGVYAWLSNVSFNGNATGLFVDPLLDNGINLASTMFDFVNCVWQSNGVGIDQYNDGVSGSGAEIHTAKAFTFNSCGWEDSTTYGFISRGWFKYCNFIGCWTEANGTAGLSGDFTATAINCNFTDTNSATNSAFRSIAYIASDVVVSALSFGPQTTYTGQTNKILSVYSEGAWTTTITPANCSAVTLSEGLYTRVGRLVTLSGRFSGTLTTTATEVGISFTLPFNQSASASRAVGSAYHTCSSASDGFSGVRDATGGSPTSAYFQAPAAQVTKANGSAFNVDFSYTYEAAA